MKVAAPLQVICLLALIFEHANLHATSWESRPAGVYYNEADTVARVKIIGAKWSSAVLDGSEINCGVTYTGQVVDSLKGADGKIVFSGQPGFAIGEEYLAFLLDSDREPSPSTYMTGGFYSAEELESRKSIEEACEAVAERIPSVNYLATSRHAFFRTWNRVTEQSEEWIAPAYVLFPRGDFPERHEIDVGVRAMDGRPVVGKQHWSADELLPPPVDAYQGMVEWSEYRRFIVESAKPDAVFDYPRPDMLPNLVDRDPETRTILPKQVPYQLESP